VAAKRGTLILVVGPSGAGKDSLIAAARAALAGERGFVFPRRLITRPPGDEDSIEISSAAYERAVAAGELLLHWRSHGFAYGIPRTAEADLAAGRTVVANVSRSVIAEAAQRLAPLRVILVTAPVAILAERLARRGRETAAAIAERLARAAYDMPKGVPVTVVDNGGSFTAALSAFLAALRDGA